MLLTAPSSLECIVAGTSVGIAPRSTDNKSAELERSIAGGAQQSQSAEVLCVSNMEEIRA
jgi:hypothetical protein